ncbi:carboxypeptidase regulatory-like domain-containing protein [Protaetiibacter sp. SSC-01]|uniref:carboxypeptidase-like regulatory domain-containing protein n=1 Tax=Protaetiibacter sp. SSC-01 TaxID=2759943 RepID=UPI001656DE01|nr:carboxypeptidase-like regulatory domain-containing protein [Protaetiibacter sp. SSC-01]QNO37767.1 carboxypeptidase regulatory-like domain-containing protein [Protaetiibacter sp. SSC-01]
MAKADIARTVRYIRTRLRDDEGISIIEVLAATMIFLMLSVGVAQATVTAIRLAGDQRHRVTALSLAASEIDLVRSISDPFDVLDRTPPLIVTVDGLDYTIHRTTSWVSGTGLDIPCGAGGTGNLQYKRVNVRVTWEGQLEPIAPVSTDTILAPDGRLNDPSRGTIIVAATRADGTGASGVNVNIAPNGGGAVALDAQPDPTNAEGCTYALQVNPGNYTVSLSRAGYVSADQTSNPSSSVTVAAGATVNAPFTYDRAGTFGITYAGGSTAARPTNLETSFINTYGVFYTSGPVPTTTLFPWSSGYRAVAGHYVAPDGTGAGGCPAVDPAEWPAATVGSTDLAAGVAPDPVAATPGGTASVNVPLATVELKSIPQNRYITAVSQNVSVAAGQPGCAVAMTYTFARISTSNSNSDRTILLPYGTWRLYTSTSSGGTSTSIGQSAIDPLSNAVTSGMVSGNQVTLDPRVAQ